MARATLPNSHREVVRLPNQDHALQLVRSKREEGATVMDVAIYLGSSEQDARCLLATLTESGVVERDEQAWPPRFRFVRPGCR